LPDSQSSRNLIVEAGCDAGGFDAEDFDAEDFDADR
jgi:hypothetical protein